MKALKNTEKYEIDGQVLECSLAKPQADHKSSNGPNLRKGFLPQIYPTRLGYGLVGNPYGALTGGYCASSLARPVIYGRGPTSAGMAMMPMLLPDGRIGYFPQQPGMQSHRHQRYLRGGKSGGSGSSTGGTRGNDNTRGHNRYSPY